VQLAVWRIEVGFLYGRHDWVKNVEVSELILPFIFPGFTFHVLWFGMRSLSCAQLVWGNNSSVQPPRHILSP
jgi:hypothetical protein